MDDSVRPATTSNRRVVIRIILLTISAGLGVATWYVYAPHAKNHSFAPDDEAGQALSEARRALKGASPTSASFFTLNPNELSFSDKLTAGPHLRDWKILSERSLDSKTTAQFLAILTAEGTYSDMGAKCFEPGMGLTFHDGSSSVDLVICLACKWVYAYVGGERFTWALSNKGKDDLLRVYKSQIPSDTKLEH